MGFEAPVGLLRILHSIAAPMFAILATFLAPKRPHLALAWLGGVLLLTAIALWSIGPAVLEAGPGFGLSAAILFGSPFAGALAATVGVALLVQSKAPDLPFLVRSGAALCGYIVGLGATQLLLPGVRLYTALHRTGAG